MRTPSAAPAENNENHQLIARLSKRLNDWSNVIPDEMIFGAGAYKMRGNWFNGTISLIKAIFLRKQVIDLVLEREVEEFITAYRARRMAAREAMQRGELQDANVRTTKEEIDTVDGFIRRCIEKLRDST